VSKKYVTYCSHVLGKAAEYFGAEFADYCGDDLCIQIIQYMKVLYGPDPENWELIDEDSEFFLDALSFFYMKMKGV
jgi:hypothetical protein